MDFAVYLWRRPEVSFHGSDGTLRLHPDPEQHLASAAGARRAGLVGVDATCRAHDILVEGV